MDTFILRFPNISQSIFEQLANENIVKFREVSPICKSFLGNNKLIWIRYIKNYSEQHGEYQGKLMYF